MKSDIGVIVGRFQVHCLHQAHHALIQEVVSQHDKVIIFLGVGVVPCTARNPLDFASREAMIRKHFPNVLVLPIEDRPGDAEWSAEIDRRIREVYKSGTVTLYGGRDSFLRSYKGGFETEELEQTRFVNAGTEVRKMIGNKVLATTDFRAGVIYATQNRYPVVYSTVDVAVVRKSATKPTFEVLLARKPGRAEYQFIGGFVDREDHNYEMAARREVLEEANIEISALRYVGSYSVDDWRYRNEVDGVATTLFMAEYVYGSIQPQDDISELRWLPLPQLGDAVMDPMHHPLLDGLLEFLDRLSPERTEESGQQHHPHGGQLQAVAP